MLGLIKAFYFTACNPSCSAQTVKKVQGSVFSTLLKRNYNQKKYFTCLHGIFPASSFHQMKPMLYSWHLGRALSEREKI